jgi:hypothetical protein
MKGGELTREEALKSWDKFMADYEKVDDDLDWRDHLAEFLVSVAAQHTYLSTACFHLRHAECRKQCKFCNIRCLCECHRVQGMQ